MTNENPSSPTGGGFGAPYNPEAELKKNYRWRLEKTNKRDDGLKRTVPMLPRDIYGGSTRENPSNTAVGRISSNPFIPLGLIATTFCLGCKFYI